MSSWKIALVLSAPIVVWSASIAGSQSPTPDVSQTSQNAYLDPRVVETVRDGNGIRQEESSAYEYVLRHVRTIDYEVQREAALKLMRVRRERFETDSDTDGASWNLVTGIHENPDFYRGKPVVIHGRVRQIETIPADSRLEEGKPAGGFQARISVGDENKSPFLVRLRTLPAGMSPADGPDQPVVVVGFFFKMTSDAKSDRESPIPLILADHFEWMRPEPSVSDLQTVRHKTRTIEREPYFQLLHRARVIDYALQKRIARSNLKERRNEIPRFRDDPSQDYPAFIDIFKNNDRWHGKLVTLRGYIRDYKWSPAGDNAYGLTRLHEGWMYTDDSQSNPAVIVCTAVPEGFPTNSDLIDNVSVTGYFFKMHAYKDQNGETRIAPMILAQRIEWSPIDDTGRRWPPAAVIYGTITVLAVGAIVLLMRSARKDRRFRETHLQPQTGSSAIDFDSIPDAAGGFDADAAAAMDAAESDPPDQD